MGRAAEYKRRFFETHQLCCFCGGGTLATTIDHIPSRATFNGRQWPVGFDFPACQRCNSVSAQQEQLIALIARVGSINPNQLEINEYQNLLQGLQNNHPAALQEMQASANQIRAFLRERGQSLGNGLVSSDVPVLSVRGPIVRAAVDDFSRKLFLSLHYKHTGKIVPQTGGVAMKWITNSTSENPEFLEAIEQLRNGLRNPPEMQRSNTRLEDQFSYKYFTNEVGTFSAYFVVFRESFAMLGNVRTDAQDFPDVMRDRGILTPFPA